MHSALFLDIPNIIKTNSKGVFPIHREDWNISQEIKNIISKHVNLNFKVFLIGNYPDVPVRRREANPIEALFVNIASVLEEEFSLPINSINFEYTTDKESFDYLPLPGMFYNLAVEHEIILPYSFVITTPVIGRFIQQYSCVKPVII